MIFPYPIFTYTPRLVCLCLACFFLVHLGVGLLVLLTAPWAIRRAARIDAMRAARFLLTLRLLPAAVATLVVAGICAPSYLWLEPEASAEEVGLACVAAALLGFTILAFSIVRGLRASRRSLQYIRRCQRMGRKTNLPANLTEDPAPVWIVNGAAPLLALTGIVRPRLVISQPVMSALSSWQLAAVLRHEHAHRLSHDNLKRLVILLSPGLFPLFRGFDKLERAWSTFTEWAADDRAVHGDGRRSLSLATALVRVARLGAAAPSPPLATSLLADSQDLAARVERLLHPGAKSRPRIPHLPAAAVLTFAALLAAVVMNPATLHGVHELLEHLIR
jgi:beta-lactamase regulating signal transducer with metallopeptidase domain